MHNFLTKIHINKIFHLENIDIEIDPKEKKHLILTGRNGCGKTSVLNALVVFFQSIKNYSEGPTDSDLLNDESFVKNLWRNLVINYKVNLEFSSNTELRKRIQKADFIFAFYGADRKIKLDVPKSPEKPNLQPPVSITESKVSEFLKFLLDLKIQEALARNENSITDAEKIKEWFDNFTLLLCDIFEDTIELDFNYKDYSFKIKQGNKTFGFNELADGYSAIVDIIADLILKMQHPASLTRAYEKEGIVLIDEIETHLHLELQKAILPMLTTVFPNIQFIVSTHSPFVLNSLKNAVAYDLENKKRLEDLTEYSYEALAEGYFEVTTDSSYLQSKLTRFKELAAKENKDTSENLEFEQLDKEFASLDKAVAPPKVQGEYLQIKLKMK
jgi:predicted ATP-binding protein involved in virulence